MPRTPHCGDAGALGFSREQLLSKLEALEHQIDTSGVPPHDGAVKDAAVGALRLDSRQLNNYQSRKEEEEAAAAARYGFAPGGTVPLAGDPDEGLRPDEHSGGDEDDGEAESEEVGQTAHLNASLLKSLKASLDRMGAAYLPPGMVAGSDEEEEDVVDEDLSI